MEPLPRFLEVSKSKNVDDPSTSPLSEAKGLSEASPLISECFSPAMKETEAASPWEQRSSKLLFGKWFKTLYSLMAFCALNLYEEW